MVNRALANTSPSHSVYVNQVATAGATAASQLAYAQAVGAQYAVGKTAADLSALLLGNMGVDNAILQTALTDYIAANGPKNIGIIALQLGQILSGLEGDATFGAAAAKWNQEVTNAYQYSSSPNNNTPQQGDDASGVTALTRFTDVVSGHEIRGFLDYNQFTGDDEQTLTISDRLTGTTANDLLFAQLTAANTRPTLTGIETVSIDAKANNVTLDLSDATGVKTAINFKSSENANLNFTNLKNLVDVEVNNTNANTTVGFNASVVAGAADSLNLIVKGAGVAAKPSNFGTNGIESLILTASESASVLGNVNNNALTGVTIKGDQNLTVGTKTGFVDGSGFVVAANGFTAANIATVSAAEATGNLFLNLAASGAQNQTITTGKGNDTVVVSQLNALDKLDLGEGTDRVVVADNGSNEATQLTGVEQIEVRVGGTNLNLTNAASVNLIAIAETAAVASINNVTAVKSGTTFAFEGDGALIDKVGGAAVANFGAVTYNLANATGSTDVINVNYSNAGVQLGANGVVNIGALVNTGNNVETLNLKFSDVGSDDTVTIANLAVGTAARTLNVTADSKVTIAGAGLAAMTGLTSVDASGVKDAFTATFGLLADAASATVKTGGAGNNNVTVDKGNGDGATGTTLTVDASAGTGSQTFTVNNTDADVTNATPSFVFVGGTGGDTLTLTSALGSINSIRGGAGTDSISLAASAGVDRLVLSLGDTGSTVATADNVTGFVTGTDKLDLRSFGFDAGLQGVTNAGAALNGGAGEFGNLAVARVVIGGNTTVYVDTNGDNKLGAGDLVVNLIGTAAFVAGDVMFI
jgi:hypothetical protein